MTFIMVVPSKRSLARDGFNLICGPKDNTLLAVFCPWLSFLAHIIGKRTFLMTWANRYRLDIRVRATDKYPVNNQGDGGIDKKGALMKKMFGIIFLLFPVCLVVFGQKQPEKIAIREMYSAWAKALEAKDVDRICAYFADDFVIPYGDSLRDKKWYREYLQKLIAEGAAWTMFLPERLEVSASGDLAYAVGYYDIVRKAGANTEKRCGLDVLKKQKDGSWKFVSFR
jgi:ketosteroid isomerase-like protein